MIVEKQMEYRLAGESEVIAENLHDLHFFSKVLGLFISVMIADRHSFVPFS
jgi:hypothetical protein